MDALICPACGVFNPVEAEVCENCSENLSAVKSVMDTANTHYNEALALAHSGKLDEAIAQLEAAIALSGMNPSYHNLLGTIYAQKGLYSEAIRAWERALALSPEAEKAYKNIEKAQRMEEEASEEQRKRPFLLTAIGACVVAAIFLMLSIYLGARVYFSSNRVDTLVQNLNTKSNEAQSWQIKYQTLKDSMPEGGLDQLIKEWTEAKKLAEERQNQLERERDRYTKIAQNHQETVTKLRNQVKTLQSEKTQLQEDLKQISGLQSIIQTNKTQIQNLQKQIQQKNEDLKAANERLEEMKDKLKLAQQTIDTIRQNREEVLTKARKSHEKATEKLHQQILDLRSEIGRHERKHMDMNYANEVLVEALKNLENNKFTLAMQNVQDALARVDEHVTALYLQDKLQRILSDPLEQEIRRQEALAREQRRAQKKEELVDLNIEKAEEFYDQGAYERAIEAARRALALAPSDQDDIDTCHKIIQESKEGKQEITMLILEARQKISEEEFKTAQSIIKKVLKRSAVNPEAKELMRQLEK